ncbi:uncharacterized protein LOC142526023 [Primulina tabacum]|uniref:uncharacterized protein LOC142526023 n=1 Tax=Primulina tabacum TaxID=48773 RepID=UPI003F5A160C
MYVDFRDINKACPKDHYSLPQIDQLVESTSRYEIFSFRDAYQVYHQIPLDKNDQDNASFITSGGTFCYVVMHFGLKNAEATYQRLMNRVFEKQLTRNVEVYVDDILDTEETQQFGWNEKCEQAFKDLKSYLTKLPVLVKPDPGEKLFVYLSTTKYAVSSVLIKEESLDQKPVYYVSHALRGPELRYNESSGRIITHSEVSGRMIKWTVELGEYNIEYRPRVAIKAQALSDFLLEMIQPDEEEVWRVFVDGASSLAGCGVRVQINGIYEAKDDRMLKYLKLIKAQTESFVDWSIEQIPRDKNGEAYALAKMAASLSEVNTREVLHITRLILSIDEEVLPAPDDAWMTPLIKFIAHNELPEYRAWAQKIKKQAPREVEYVLREIHEGCCGEHLGGTTLAWKAMLAGFWWRSISQESFRVVWACEGRLISDNGRQFQEKEITSWCQEMKITQSFTSVAYPQAKGQTKPRLFKLIMALVKAGPEERLGPIFNCLLELGRLEEGGSPFILIELSDTQSILNRLCPGKLSL